MKSKQQGLRVEVRNGDFAGAMRKFKRKVQDSGILQEVKDRQEYIQPSQQRKKAKASAKARWQKKVQRMEEQGLVPIYKKIKRGK